MISVLLVDDNDTIRKMIRTTLELQEGKSYQVFEACNGEEAIDILTETVVDVVVLDLQMPITDGWETLRIIRDPENGWPNVRVVMLTVQKEAENALKAWTIGADYFVSKPFEVTSLVETIDRAASVEAP